MAGIGCRHGEGRPESTQTATRQAKTRTVGPRYSRDQRWPKLARRGASRSRRPSRRKFRKRAPLSPGQPKPRTTAISRSCAAPDRRWNVRRVSQVRQRHWNSTTDGHALCELLSHLPGGHRKATRGGSCCVRAWPQAKPPVHSAHQLALECISKVSDA